MGLDLRGGEADGSIAAAVQPKRDDGDPAPSCRQRCGGGVAFPEYVDTSSAPEGEIWRCGLVEQRKGWREKIGN